MRIRSITAETQRTLSKRGEFHLVICLSKTSKAALIITKADTTEAQRTLEITQRNAKPRQYQKQKQIDAQVKVMLGSPGCHGFALRSFDR